MKKRIISLLAVLLLTVSLCIPAQAAGFADESPDFVTDAAGILSDRELTELARQAEDISTEYQCGVYIIIVNDFTDYTHAGTVYEAAKSLYREYALGYGSEKSGELLLLSMVERDYALIAYGYGNTAFTDYGKDRLSDAFLDDFRDDDWYGGLSDYLEQSASMLKAARNGQPVDVDSDPTVGLAGIGICLLLSFGLALLVCWILKECQMKSAAVKTEANAYLSAGSITVTSRQDQFTHITKVRQKIESSSGSGGGGTSVGKSGFSGKSGKF